jgi:lipoprotein-releasing system permease protein
VNRFALFIARRYLRARRKEAVISVITVISVLGVAVGVMALVIALAVNNGFRGTLQRNLLGAMAHINVMPKEPGAGVEHWQEMAAKLRKVPHVTAVSPALYGEVLLTGALRAPGAEIKGVEVDQELAISEMLRKLKSGSLDLLRDPSANPPGIVVGSVMAEENGITTNSRVQVTSPYGEMAGPLGMRPATRWFRVAGVFSTGFYEIDKAWVFASLPVVQRLLASGDQVNQIELNVDDLNHADTIAKEVEKAAGPEYTTTTWMERNKQLLGALKMERVVTVITIGLIELVAAFNIFITLVMMVMQKYRDIAVLMSLGAKRAQVRWIFMLQGVLIGVVGSAIGLVVGYSLCYYANKYQLVPLDPSIYALSYVPFEPRPLDGLWIAAAAILVSFVATIYPARNATKILPAEVLRYE